MNDLTSLGLAELRDLLRAIEAEIDRREEAERSRALEEMRRFALERGFSLEELFGAHERVAGLRLGHVKVPPKYRNPQTGQTWTGRGKMPTWVRKALERGLTLEQLLIERSTTT